MASAINILCNIYARHIRENNINNDEIIEYEYSPTYYRSSRTATCTLSSIDASAVLYCARAGIIDVTQINLSDSEKLLYQACILVAENSFQIATDIYVCNLCNSASDAKYVRSLIIDLYCGESILFDDEDFIKRMNLSADEKQRLLRKALSKNFNITRLLTENASLLNDDLKNRIISLLRLDHGQAKYYLQNNNITRDFRMLIFKSIFTEKDYYDVFSQIYRHVVEDDEIRTITFNSIITNPNTYYNFFEELIPYLSVREKMLVCNKFYKQIFSDSSSYKTYFNNCCMFGQWLRKNERLILIKKLHTKTRVKNIPYAKRQINFTEEELDQLRSIELAYKLR